MTAGVIRIKLGNFRYPLKSKPYEKVFINWRIVNRLSDPE